MIRVELIPVRVHAGCVGQINGELSEAIRPHWDRIAARFNKDDFWKAEQAQWFAVVVYSDGDGDVTTWAKSRRGLPDNTVFGTAEHGFVVAVIACEHEHDHQMEWSSHINAEISLRDYYVDSQNGEISPRPGDLHQPLGPVRGRREATRIGEKLAK